MLAIDLTFTRALRSLIATPLLFLTVFSVASQGIKGNPEVIRESSHFTRRSSPDMDLDEPSKERFSTLAKGAYLDVLLPRTSAFDAESVLQKGSTDELGKVSVRRNLFFGKHRCTHPENKRLTETQMCR